MNVLGFEIHRALYRRRRWTPRRVFASVAVTGVVVGAVAAYAAWTSTATGNGAAKAGSVTVTLAVTSTSSGTAITNTLRPGSVAGTASGDATGGDLKMTLNNTSGFTVHVTSVAINGLVTNDKTGSGCTNDQGPFTFPNAATPGNHGVTVGSAGTYTVVPTTFTVPGTGVNTDIVIPNALNMATSSNTGCQSAVFTIPVTVTVST
jgi:phosphatidate phosphatase APP1